MTLFIIAKQWKLSTWANIGEWLNYDTATKEHYIAERESERARLSNRKCKVCCSLCRINKIIYMYLFICAKTQKE